MWITAAANLLFVHSSVFIILRIFVPFNLCIFSLTLFISNFL